MRANDKLLHGLWGVNMTKKEGGEGKEGKEEESIDFLSLAHSPTLSPHPFEEV
ncbi:MAG: hypothetical protein L0220_17770 [Acidobacteria bacterium]|nr:hypothetical protein [Acidobacteriota bacterium]